MRDNTVLDVLLPDGSSFSGDTTDLITLDATATEDQSVFVFEELEDGEVFLCFVDGVKFTQVTSLTAAKQFTFTAATGTITLFAGVPVDNIISVFGAAAGASLTAQDEPVDNDEVRTWLRIDEDTDTVNDELDTLIKACRIKLERVTGVSFVSRTVTAHFKNELGGIYLPYGPVREMISLTDEDGNVIDSDDYTLLGSSFKRIKECLTGEHTAVYTAGYDTIPYDMRLDLLNQIGWAYENRGDQREASKLSPNLSLSYSRNG